MGAGTHREREDAGATASREARALGARVRATRLRQRLTLEQASERMGLDLKHLQKIEAGQLNATLGTLARIARGLGVSLTVPVSSSDVRSPAPADPAAQKYARENPVVLGGASRADTPVDPDAILTLVGRRVAEIRAARRLTQRELASAIDQSLTFVQRLESGRQKTVALRDVASVAQTLGVPFVELLRPPTRPRAPRGRPSRREA